MGVVMTEGGVQVTLAALFKAVAATLVGWPGEANGVTALEAVDDGP
jgi:hypothetical protein